MQDAPAWHLSYHDGEHYNSVQPSEGVLYTPATGNGPRWTEQQIQRVQQGTGCGDEAAVCRALDEAKGSCEQVGLGVSVLQHPSVKHLI